MTARLRMPMTLLCAFWGLAAVPALALDIPATIRDFRIAHPDFEDFVAGEATTGIVSDDLGTDRKPVYVGNASMTSGREAFDQWYRDVPGVNQARTVFLPLVEQNDGTLSFASDAFFPIDGQGFGNEGNPHNFHFTTEVHLTFTYRGGETFAFEGDDDLWVFINNRLALDLGGTHPAISGSVDLDADAEALGIVAGETYRLDLFHAERHTSESNFRLTTTLGLTVDGDDDDDDSDDANGDGIPDDQQDLDGDGLNDFPDDNDDGIPDGCDISIEGGLFCPPGLLPDMDGDGIPDVLDLDRDGDGIPNVDDDDQDGDGQADAQDDDLDGDGVANLVDQDVDGDGVRNRDDDRPWGEFAAPPVGEEPDDVPPIGAGGCGGCAGPPSPLWLVLLAALRRRPLRALREAS